MMLISFYITFYYLYSNLCATNSVNHKINGSLCAFTSFGDIFGFLLITISLHLPGVILILHFFYYLCISFYSSFNNNIIILISYGPAVVSYFISIITCGLLYMFVFSESFIIVTPLVFYFALHGWSRDVVRETIKKCNMVSVNVFIFGFAPFVLSEGILFISVFWGLVHFMLTPFFSNHEALFVPDATELTYANTLLLSNAAISLGSAYSTRENLILFGAPNSASFILAWAFLSLQIKEFRNLGFYLSDSVYGCIFFILSGLHFLHVIVGLMLLGIYSNFGETFDCIYLIVCQDLYFSIHLLYWHFVEVIWLLLYYFLYLYWMLLYNLFCVNTKGSYYA